MMKKNILFSLLVTISVFAAGCSGYTQKTNLPDHIQSVSVEKISNGIDLSSEVSTDKVFQTYRPGLEVELRNAVIERFVFDGHLKIAQKSDADAVLRGELTRFDRDPTRYNSDDSIQEFRIQISAELEFVDSLNDKVIWRSTVTGDSSYFVTGRNARSEDEAVAEALEDLARRVVEQIIEVW